MTYLLSDLQNFLWPAPPSAATILVIDVDEHGGSKLLCNLNLGPVETSIPSIGCNYELVKHRGVTFVYHGLGGGYKRGSLGWLHIYYKDVKAIIVVARADASQALTELGDELREIIWKEDVDNRRRLERARLAAIERGAEWPHPVVPVENLMMAEVPVLILLERGAAVGAVSTEYVVGVLELEKNLEGRHWHIERCSIAESNEGLRQGFEWLASETADEEQKVLSRVAKHFEAPKAMQWPWSS